MSERADGIDRNRAAIETGAMGHGPFPAELDRINWGVVFMPGLWALFHGIWSWWLIEAVLWVAWTFGAWQLRILGGGRSDSAPVVVGILCWAVLTWLLAVWFGAHGNERIWRREAARRALGLPGHSVTGFRGNERVWAWGLGLWSMLGIISMLWGAWADPAKNMGGAIGTGGYMAITAVALAIAWMTDHRWRESAADLLER